MKLQICDLCKQFDGVAVLDHVSMELESGHIYCLTAPSGKGKTTLFRILMGLETADSGRLFMERVPIGAVFQEDRLLEGLDAAGNLRFALGPAYDTRAAEAMLEELGLADVGSKPVGALSGGMKRRLALARALLAPSEAIALDEPFTGLDDENRQRAIRAIRRVAETKPVLLVTHDREDLAALDARIIRLRRGDEQ